MKEDLYAEIIRATKLILEAEGLSNVGVEVKLGVRATYHRKVGGKVYIQYGGESIEDKLDLSRGVKYLYRVYEADKLYRYDGEFNNRLTPRERIACLIIEETTHAIASSKGYRGKHGGYFIYTYLETWKKYYYKVMDILKSVSKYENVSIDEMLANVKRLERVMKAEEELFRRLGLSA